MINSSRTLEDMEEEETFESLYSILRVSSLLVVIDAREYALRRLDRWANTRNSPRLCISCDLFLPAWVHPAAKASVKAPVSEFTGDKTPVAAELTAGDLSDLSTLGLKHLLHIVS